MKSKRSFSFPDEKREEEASNPKQHLGKIKLQKFVVPLCQNTTGLKNFDWNKFKNKTDRNSLCKQKNCWGQWKTQQTGAAFWCFRGRRVLVNSPEHRHQDQRRNCWTWSLLKTKKKKENAHSFDLDVGSQQTDGILPQWLKPEQVKTTLRICKWEMTLILNLRQRTI